MLRYAPLLLALVCWIWPPVIIRRLGLSGLDVFSQNALRVSVATLAFLPLGFAFHTAGMKRALASWRRFVAPAACMVLSQTLAMVGMVRVGATFSSLVSRSDILLTILVGALLFADERLIVKQRGFLPAVLVALLGVSGIVLFRKGAGGDVATGGREFAIGMICILLSQVLWVSYVYAVKLAVKGSGAAVTLVMTTALGAIGSLLIWLACWRLGLVATQVLRKAGAYELGLIAFSGLASVGGGLFFIQSIELVGATVSQSGILASPLLVGIAAFFLLHELPTIGQLLSGLVLLAGLAAILYIDHKARVNRAAGRDQVTGDKMAKGKGTMGRAKRMTSRQG